MYVIIQIITYIITLHYKYFLDYIYYVNSSILKPEGTFSGNFKCKYSINHFDEHEPCAFILTCICLLILS